MSAIILTRRILLLVFGCCLLVDSVLLIVSSGAATNAVATSQHVKAIVASESAAQKIARALSERPDKVSTYERSGVRRVKASGYVLKFSVPGHDLKPSQATLVKKGFPCHIDTEDDGSNALFLEETFSSQAAAARRAAEVRRATPLSLTVSERTVKQAAKLWTVDFLVPDQTAAETLRSNLRSHADVIQVI